MCKIVLVDVVVIIYYVYFFQTVFADQPQVAYIQQDGTTQQVSVAANVMSLTSSMPHGFYRTREQLNLICRSQFCCLVDRT